MQVFIMRHGDAATKAPSDSQRPLTEQGRKQSIQLVSWLQQKNRQENRKIEKVLVSPYLRAQQTFTAIRDHADIPLDVQTLNELTPNGDPCRLAEQLRLLATENVTSVLIISHLPLVGYLVSELCPDETPPMFPTSAIACVSLSNANGKGELDWLVSPANIDRV